MSTVSRRTGQPAWLVPAFAVAMGLVLFGAGWAGGSVVAGLGMLVAMVLVALGSVLAARRSETVKGLLDHRDERIASIDLQASALSGLVLIVAVIVGFVVSLAQGHDGSPYGQLAAIGGVTYILAVIGLRLRG
jgi:small-conductance mechanosensitive channel